MIGGNVSTEGRMNRGAAEAAIEQTCARQALRRAARWHAWLKSPECTLQDRENFRRWCDDPTNAAAYDALCREVASPHATSRFAGAYGESDFAGGGFLDLALQTEPR